MAREINRLSAREVSTKTVKGRYADGGGLYLQVSDSGAKSWLFRFMQRGKARQMGLGPLHTVSLAEARHKAEQQRKLLLDGTDPIMARKVLRQQGKVEAAKTVTFKDCAVAYIKAHSPAWDNIKHAQQWENTLKTYAYPHFGDFPVSSLDTGLVMKAVEPIWATKSETASRVRGRIEAILDWATTREYRQGENPARWKGHLSNLLPARSKVRKVKHHSAMPFDSIGDFVIALRKQTAVSARGIELLILTAARTGEAIGATWTEFDLDNALWVIPAERMKARKEHRIPLSTRAVEIVKEMAETRVSDFVFPGLRKNRPLSNMAFLQLLKRMGHGDLTAHGFRSTFRDWAAERTGYPHEMAEMALAHTISNKVEAAYRRGDMFEKRQRMMRDWAEFCSTASSSSSDNVLPMNAGAI